MRTFHGFLLYLLIIIIVIIVVACVELLFANGWFFILRVIKKGHDFFGFGFSGFFPLFLTIFYLGGFVGGSMLHFPFLVLAGFYTGTGDCLLDRKGKGLSRPGSFLINP